MHPERWTEPTAMNPTDGICHGRYRDSREEPAFEPEGRVTRSAVAPDTGWMGRTRPSHAVLPVVPFR